MKIEGPKNISDIFSIFHDGCIVSCHYKNDSLVMEVEIQYLAERINPSFQKFTVRLDGVSNLYFSTWPRDRKSEPEILRGIETIFKPELEILKGTIEEGQVIVFCDQSLLDFDYCGGDLYLSAISAEVTDETGKSYSIEELGILCKSYWDDWANKNNANSAETGK
jgi:hypothetical protein